MRINFAMGASLRLQKLCVFSGFSERIRWLVYVLLLFQKMNSDLYGQVLRALLSSSKRHTQRYTLTVSLAGRSDVKNHMNFFSWEEGRFLGGEGVE